MEVELGSAGAVVAAAAEVGEVVGHGAPVVGEVVAAEMLTPCDAAGGAAATPPPWPPGSAARCCAAGRAAGTAGAAGAEPPKRKQHRVNFSEALPRQRTNVMMKLLSCIGLQSSFLLSPEITP